MWTIKTNKSKHYKYKSEQTHYFQNVAYVLYMFRNHSKTCGLNIKFLYVRCFNYYRCRRSSFRMLIFRCSGRCLSTVVNTTTLGLKQAKYLTNIDIVYSFSGSLISSTQDFFSTAHIKKSYFSTRRR
ncbi:hypothetical protein EDEG_01582 [Edhazardia aedis USNM 41457]|uniref:Uncharacterized protein n=1 Tax=Edhazardia aedis (strain USNM 41457) TaxID=1003232 RepID=J9D8R9_EDHAE|nr:hypothetical protein EDEG_01582 [Edhazardia aedis USNM 41457]|eukprot:EJW04146.1 hypothetical protein EDEG_01582 [Edhazardia aedis USNM 41457]